MNPLGFSRGENQIVVGVVCDVAPTCVDEK